MTKIDARTAIDATTVSVAKKLKCITLIVATQVAMTTRSSTASSCAADDNFAVFESPAKLAAEAKRGSAVANKEVAMARKRKPDAVTVSPQKKKAKPSKKVVESDSDEENDDDENFLASCGKVLDRDPLDI